MTPPVTAAIRWHLPNDPEEIITSAPSLPLSLFPPESGIRASGCGGRESGCGSRVVLRIRVAQRDGGAAAAVADPCRCRCSLPLSRSPGSGRRAAGGGSRAAGGGSRSVSVWRSGMALPLPLITDAAAESGFGRRGAGRGAPGSRIGIGRRIAYVNGADRCRSYEGRVVKRLSPPRGRAWLARRDPAGAGRLRRRDPCLRTNSYPPRDAQVGDHMLSTLGRLTVSPAVLIASDCCH